MIGSKRRLVVLDRPGLSCDGPIDALLGHQDSSLQAQLPTKESVVLDKAVRIRNRDILVVEQDHVRHALAGHDGSSVNPHATAK